MNRFRIPILLLFTVVTIALVFFGAQLQVPSVMALPSFASFNSAAPTANTCAVSGCHTGTVSTTAATITLPAGVTTYTPGGPSIPISVTIPGTSFSTWGFQLSARMASNLATQGGNFNAGDNGSTGTTGGSSTFALNWTPPPTGTTGNVNFYLSGDNTNSVSSSNLFSVGMVTLAQAAAAVADFSLAASPTSVSLAQGASGSSTVTVTPKNGFTGAVALAASGLPTGVTAAFSPASATTTSALTLTASSTAVAGTSTVTLTGTSGTLSHTATVSLTVTAATPAPNFSLSASPNSVTVAQSASGTSTITTTATNGFTGTVALAASGMPAGVTASFASNVLTLTASSTAAGGTSTITITGTSGTLSHTTTVSLTVTATTPAPNFSLSASPNSLTVAQGASGTSTITTTPSNGFTGTVALAASGMPTGVTASFASNVLTLAASSTAAAGTSTITITGTSGMLTHSTTVSLTVSGTTTGGGALTVSPTSISFTYQRGSATGSRSLAITSTGGKLTYSVSTTGGTWLTATPASGSTPGSVTVSANGTNLSRGTYTGTVYVNSPGAAEKSVPVTLTVTSSTGCDDGCGGGSSMYAQPTVTDPGSTGNVAAMWIDHLGIPTGNQSADPGLVLSKNGSATAGAHAGALIVNYQGSLTELGFDYREGGQCTATSPRFIVVTTDSVTHTVGGCSKGTITAAPAVGWKRVRFNLAETTQTSPAITPGEQVSSITLVMDEGPQAGASAAGGLVVIDNIDVNGTFAGKTATRTTSTTTTTDN